jgi:hypothetical protein
LYASRGGNRCDTRKYEEACPRHRAQCRARQRYCLSNWDYWM